MQTVPFNQVLAFRPVITVFVFMCRKAALLPFYFTPILPSIFFFSLKERRVALNLYSNEASYCEQYTKKLSKIQDNLWKCTLCMKVYSGITH